jgi:hypothetical protein
LPGAASIRSRFIAQNASFRQQHHFQYRLFAELGENPGNPGIIWPVPFLLSHLPRPKISISIGTHKRGNLPCAVAWAGLIIPPSEQF